MFDLIASILDFFYSAVHDYAAAISLLTLAVMVVVLPLTLRGTRSMLELQRHQPELKRIQARYKDDRQKMNEEVMKFYQANSINPVGGCLPLFVQLPVFLVLFRVIRGLTRRHTDMGDHTGSVAGAFGDGASAIGAFDFPQENFNPQYLSSDSEMRSALESVDQMNSFGIDLSKSASEQIGQGFTTAAPYVLMILIVFATGWYQQRQIQGRAGSSVNPQQQAIMKFMPFFLPVISFGLPAAMLVYFIVSNVFRVAQQAYITRSMYSGEDSPAALARRAREESEGETKTEKSGGGTKTKAKPKTKAKKSQKNAAGAAEARSSKRGRTKAGDRQKSAKARSTPGTSSRTTPAGTVAPRARKKKRK